jgi:hypothetical protein
MPEQHVLCVIISQLDCTLAQHFPVREDVAQFRAPFTQDLAYQEPAMALVRLSAAAQQRDAMLGCAAQNPVDRVAERRLHGHPVIQRVTVGVELIFAPWSPTQRRAEVRIANATLLDRGLQLIAVEVGCVARVRMGSYVHQMRDLVALYQVEEHHDIVV